LPQSALSPGRISVAVEKCERKEKNFSGASEKAFDLLFDVIEITATVNSGVADQQNSLQRFHLLYV
jgi:hypothetical protein